MASPYGIILAFETMETPFMDTVQKACHYVRKINSPYLQIYPDLGNVTMAAYLYGHDVSDDIKSGAGHIVALHLKETAPNKYRDVPYGTGHVDFSSAIRTACEIGVRRFVGEFWAADDFQAQIDHANVFLRSFFRDLV